MMGQAGHFLNAAPEKIPYAAKRYIDETKRLFQVYEDRLAEEEGREFLIGEGTGKFSYADIVRPVFRVFPPTSTDPHSSFFSCRSPSPGSAPTPSPSASLLSPKPASPSSSSG